MIVAQLAGEDLRLGAQPAIGGAVYDPVAIALKRAAIPMLRLGMLAAGRLRTVHRVGRQQGPLASFDGF